MEEELQCGICLNELAEFTEVNGGGRGGLQLGGPPVDGSLTGSPHTADQEKSSALYCRPGSWTAATTGECRAWPQGRGGAMPTPGGAAAGAGGVGV